MNYLKSKIKGSPKQAQFKTFVNDKNIFQTRNLLNIQENENKSQRVGYKTYKQ
jgi:hypothetical protein